jgi:hypothetical protein
MSVSAYRSAADRICARADFHVAQSTANVAMQQWQSSRQ